MKHIKKLFLSILTCFALAMPNESQALNMGKVLRIGLCGMAFVTVARLVFYAFNHRKLNKNLEPVESEDATRNQSQQITPDTRLEVANETKKYSNDILALSEKDQQKIINCKNPTQNFNAIILKIVPSIGNPRDETIKVIIEEARKIILTDRANKILERLNNSGYKKTEPLKSLYETLIEVSLKFGRNTISHLDKMDKEYNNTAQVMFNLIGNYTPDDETVHIFSSYLNVMPEDYPTKLLTALNTIPS